MSEGLGFPLIVTIHQPSIFIFIYTLLLAGSRTHVRRIVETLHKGMIFRKSGSIRKKKVHFRGLQRLNSLTPNDPYRGRTAPLTSKRCNLYIYPTNIGTEYFKHGIYSPYFYLQNAVCFIILTYLVPVLFTFYIQGVRKLKK